VVPIHKTAARISGYTNPALNQWLSNGRSREGIISHGSNAIEIEDIRVAELERITDAKKPVR